MTGRSFRALNQLVPMNIIFGGGIGAIIDHNTGTGYDYPNQLPVKMGESVVVDRKTEQQTAQAPQ